MLHHIETYLSGLVSTLPLELFVFVGSFIEEIIAPIPSPTIPILTGSLAATQEYSLYGIFLLAIIAAIGKTCGACVVYTIANKAENALTTHFAKLLPLSHTDIESFGAKLRGGFRDYFALILLRAFPFMPSVVVSVGSGVLKVRMHMFIITTFLGTIIRDSLYLYFGYAGITILGSLIEQFNTIEQYIEYSVLAGVIFMLIFLSLRRIRPIIQR